MNNESQLNPCGWFLEEQTKTEETLNHLRKVFGTYRTDKDPTYAFLEGYLAGIKAMYRKFEEFPK